MFEGTKETVLNIRTSGSNFVRRIRESKHGRHLLTAPALAVIFFLIVVPTLVLVEISFSPLSGGSMVKGFTLEHYERLFSDSTNWTIILRTFRIAFLVTLFTFLLGYPLAYAATRGSDLLAKTIIITVLLPLSIDIIVRTFGWLILLQPGGIFFSVLTSTGLISTGNAPELLYNETGMVIGLVHVLLPFMVFPLINVLNTIPYSLEEAALDLGANRAVVFLKVLLPLSLPGIAAGTFVVFMVSMASYVTPYILGGTNRVMAIVITEQILSSQNFPYASAYAIVLVLMGLLAILAYQRVIANFDTAGGI